MHWTGGPRSRPVRIGRAWLTGSRQASLRSGQRGSLGEVGILWDTNFISSDPCVSAGLPPEVVGSSPVRPARFRWFPKGLRTPDRPGSTLDPHFGSAAGASSAESRPPAPGPRASRSARSSVRRRGAACAGSSAARTPVRSQNLIRPSSMGPSRVRPSQIPDGRHRRPGGIAPRVRPGRLRARRVPRWARNCGFLRLSSGIPQCFRALDARCQRGGRRFEPCLVLQFPSPRPRVPGSGRRYFGSMACLESRGRRR